MLNFQVLGPLLEKCHPQVGKQVRTLHHQMDTLLQCFCLYDLGYPACHILSHAPELFLQDERRSAAPFFSALALLGGTHSIRSHGIRTVHRVRQVMGLYLL